MTSPLISVLSRWWSGRRNPQSLQTPMASPAAARPKVFGVGIAKSGTKTLGRCFRELGYRNCSIRDDLVPAAVGDPAAVIAAAEAFESFEDFPWFWFYEPLSARYPDARFVLTRRRDDDTWRRSFHNHMRTIPAERIELGRQLAEKFLPGVPIDDLHRVHNERVRAFFADRPGRLLEVCWEETPSWEALCAFLGCPLPAVPFPHENRGDYAGPSRHRPPAAAAPARLTGIASGDYAERFGAVWRPTHPPETVDWPAPRTLPGGPGTPPAIDFGAMLQRHFPALGVLELGGARLFQPSGWILGADRLLLANHTWFAHEFDRNLSTAGPLAETIRRESGKWEETPLPGTTLSLLTDFGHRNYGHFLLDALGRLALVEAAGIDLESVDRILVPKPCSPGGARILAAMRLPTEKLVTVDAEPRGILLPERLVAPTFPGAPRCYRPFLARFLRERVLGPAPPARPATRVYVDRTGPKRPLENREEVLAVMEEHGFRIYDPSAHDEPPAYFQAARVVVGAHGAGLADLVFLPPGARVLEFLPTDHVYPYYFTLALAAGHDHAFLPCRSAGERPPSAGGPSPFSFRVDIDALRGALAAIGCG